jgi:hypothetical protein
MAYSGFCIGGPEDGEFYTSEYTRFDAVETEDSPDRGPLGVHWRYLSQETTNKITQYRFDVLHFSAKPVGFWLPDGMTSYEAITRLIEGYAMNVQRKKNEC